MYSKLSHMYDDLGYSKHFKQRNINIWYDSADPFFLLNTLKIRISLTILRINELARGFRSIYNKISILNYILRNKTRPKCVHTICFIFYQSDYDDTH